MVVRCGGNSMGNSGMRGRRGRHGSKMGHCRHGGGGRRSWMRHCGGNCYSGYGMVGRGNNGMRDRGGVMRGIPMVSVVSGGGVVIGIPVPAISIALKQIISHSW